jgi:nucleoside-diphosphate-sugar epimerase
VTGATGFIGRHLVEELLKRDDVKVFALVREGSRGRLDDLAKQLDAGDRLVPVPGDLSTEGLGIEGFEERIDPPRGHVRRGPEAAARLPPLEVRVGEARAR